MFSSSVVRPKDIELAQPPLDSVSKIQFSPTGPHLAVGSWDNAVRIYEVSNQGQNQPKLMFNHEAPVLDLTWSANGQHVISAGCDNAARMVDLNQPPPQGQPAQQVAAHDAPIKCVEMTEINGTQVLVTAGWDKKLKYWDLRSPNPMGEVELSDRAFTMSTAQKLLVVGTADRKLDVFNLDQPMTKWRTTESPLKWQTRVVSCFPSGEAYAVGSVEGRVAIQYPGDENKPACPTATAPGDIYSRNYSFKCHRYEIPAGSMPGTPAVSGSSAHVFAINDITFHKTEGTCCTGGSDGSLTFWDVMARTKLKPFTPKDLNNGNTDDPRRYQWGLPVVSSSFNNTHEIFAYALAYDWSKGHSGVPPTGQPVNKIMLHPVQSEEVKKKPPKK